MSIQPNAYFGLVTGENGNDDYDGTEWGLGVDFNYFIRDNIAIKAGVGYLSQDIEFDNSKYADIETSGFRTNVGLAVYF